MSRTSPRWQRQTLIVQDVRQKKTGTTSQVRADDRSCEAIHVNSEAVGKKVADFSFTGSRWL